MVAARETNLEEFKTNKIKLEHFEVPLTYNGREWDHWPQMYKNEDYENPETSPHLLLSLYFFISQWSEISWRFLWLILLKHQRSWKTFGFNVYVMKDNSIFGTKAQQLLPKLAFTFQWKQEEPKKPIMAVMNHEGIFIVD